MEQLENCCPKMLAYVLNTSGYILKRYFIHKILACFEQLDLVSGLGKKDQGEVLGHVDDEDA